MACRVELPRLEPIYRKYRDQGLSIVAVESRGDRAAARKFIQEKDLTYTFLENGKGDKDIVNDPFKVFAYPSMFVLDSRGRVLYFHLGFEPGDEARVEREVALLLSA